MTESAARDGLSKTMRLAGVEKARRTLHSLRASFATHLPEDATDSPIARLSAKGLSRCAGADASVSSVATAQQSMPGRRDKPLFITGKFVVVSRLTAAP